MTYRSIHACIVLTNFYQVLYWNKFHDTAMTYQNDLFKDSYFCLVLLYIRHNIESYKQHLFWKMEIYKRTVLTNLNKWHLITHCIEDLTVFILYKNLIHHMVHCTNNFSISFQHLKILQLQINDFYNLHIHIKNYM